MPKDAAGVIIIGQKKQIVIDHQLRVLVLGVYAKGHQ